jgi:hypothetical protein
LQKISTKTRAAGSKASVAGHCCDQHIDGAYFFAHATDTGALLASPM